MLFILLFLIVLNCVKPNGIEALVDLYDGETLEGWTQKGGEAKYMVEDREIVGISKILRLELLMK